MYLPASVSVATILCGTNNMDNNVYQPHDIADSVIACGTKIEGKTPSPKSYCRRDPAQGRSYFQNKE